MIALRWFAAIELRTTLWTVATEGVSAAAEESDANPNKTREAASEAAPRAKRRVEYMTFSLHLDRHRSRRDAVGHDLQYAGTALDPGRHVEVGRGHCRVG